MNLEVYGSRNGCSIGEKHNKVQDGYDISNPGPGAYDISMERSKSGAKIGRAHRGTFNHGLAPGPGAYDPEYRGK